MKYCLIILPESLKKTIISESKRLIAKVYNKKVEKLYYRIETKEKLDNPRRLFIKGNGQIIETEIDPHISLIYGQEIKNINNFIKSAQKICSNYSAFNLEFDKKGNYDMNFTFFVGFKNIPTLEKLRSDLLDLSKPFMSKEEYQQHIEVGYIPHATIIYDDIDPKKISQAYDLLNIKKFQKPILVKEIFLCEMSSSGQKIVAKLNLNI